jgi:hypothetical protein
MLLKNDIFGRNVVFVGDSAYLQSELLWGLKGSRTGDQVSGETAGEEVSRGARHECEAEERQSED